MNFTILNLKESKFVWFLGIFFVLFFIITIINERFILPDFHVYVHAANNLVNDNPVYHQEYRPGSGIYKYAPFSLFFYIPFTFLSDFFAKTVYFWLIAAGITFLMLFLKRFVDINLFDKKLPVTNSTVLFLSFLVVVVHFHRELELGNVNLFLLLALVLSLYFILSEREYIGGTLIGIAILFKPHFLVVLPLMVMRRKWRSLLAVVLVIVVGSLLPIIVVGWQGNLTLQAEWFQTMSEHNAGWRLIENPNTIHHWIYLLGLQYFISEPGTVFSYVVILLVAILFLIWIVRNMKVEMRQGNSMVCKHFIHEYFLILAIIPNITYTDTEHFLFSLPLIMFILICIIQWDYKKSLLFYLTVLGFIFYGGNWHDLWGHDISVWIERFGLLGLGNLLIIITSIFYFLKLNFIAPTLDGDKSVIHS